MDGCCQLSNVCPADLIGEFMMKPCCFLFGLMVLSSFAWAEDSADYLNRVKPVLQSRCFACHGVLKQEGGLRLDTAALAVKGGDSGPAVMAKDAAGSRLLLRVSSHDEAERMPPEGEPLKPEEIAAIRAWIESGVPAPADEPPERDPREHWAFQVPKRPAVPVVDWNPVGDAGPTPCLNPIDAFLAAKQRDHGLRPQPVADKRIWLRRVSIDLIGLPPTREEMDAFLADQSATAFDTVVTRLLQSPQYGERWGRHWMDIWRYSDWWGLGEDARNSMKHIWHWRDWIVESLNADKGYDQMLREMLAADELYPEDNDRLRAGGFLSRQYFKFNRTSWLDETIEHTSKGMLGLTFNCGKCHDHKYDPFTQQDYYRYRAIFEPYQVRLDSAGGQIDFEKDGIPRPFDCNLDTKTFVHIRGDDRNPDTSKVMEPAFPAFLAVPSPPIEPVTLPPLAVQPGLNPQVVDAYLKQAEQQIADRQAKLDVARKQLTDAEVRETRLASLTPEEKLKNSGAVLVRDDFSVDQPEVWQTLEGKWAYADGKLIQSQDGATRGVLRLRQQAPVDFEAKLTYVPTGGQMWKSVGMTFDGTDTNEFLAYLSSYADGPKAQFAYKKGDYVYPAEAAQARPVPLQQVQELTLRVRGQLINMSVNGQPAVAYRIPVPRVQGLFQLITFDATAEFRLFELRALSPDTVLVEPASGTSSGEAVVSVENAKLAVAVAEKSLDWAATIPTSIRARAAAERARFLEPADAGTPELVKAAVRAERVSAAAKAEEEVARLTMDLARAAADKKMDLENKLTMARTNLDNARKQIDEAGETYTPIRGASKALESNLETEDSRLKSFPAVSTGRRTALAKWMTDSKNPLTARVAVNHIWSRHFGRPLVPTVFDFGRKGAQPTHPELLDWLAVELRESGQGSPTDSASNGWSMKHIHRLIVTSNAYRMTSSSVGAAATNLERDAENRFYWRMNPIRMQSQIVRDSLLSLSGDLDLTMGGPSIPTSNETSRRRSLYFVHSNIDHQKFLSVFDDASVLDCYRRAESIVPQQALALENSPLANEVAQKIAARLLATDPAMTDARFIREAFVTILSVEPTEAEQSAAANALVQLVALMKSTNRNDPTGQARISLVQALLNHNDFVTVR